jgi:hypothetical protein
MTSWKALLVVSLSLSILGGIKLSFDRVEKNRRSKEHK